MASVAWQPLAAATIMARVDRLDLVLAYLEEMHHHHRHIGGGSISSPSTPASATTLSDSSASSTPRGSRSASWRRACRPAKEVLEEAQAKGSLVDRIAFLEDRVLRMEDDIEITPEKTSMTTSMSGGGDDRKEKKVHQHGNSKKKGLKSLVKSCVKGKLKTKD